MKKWIWLLAAMILLTGCFGGSGGRMPTAKQDVLIAVNATEGPGQQITQVTVYWRSGLNKVTQQVQQDELPASFELKDLTVGHRYQYWVRVEGEAGLLWQTNAVEFVPEQQTSTVEVNFPADHSQELAVAELQVQMSDSVGATGLPATTSHTSNMVNASSLQSEHGALPDRVSLLLEPDTSLDDLERMGYEVLQYLPSLHRAIVSRPGNQVLALSMSGIIRVDPVYAYTTMADPVQPNDPRYRDQWALPNIGMPNAWGLVNENTPVRQVRIAVLDTPFATNHPDLRGKFDMFDAADFAPEDTRSSSMEDHGTHVAGIIGAIANNREGIAGVDWNVRLVPVSVLNAAGDGNTDTVRAGMEYAAGLAADSDGRMISAPVDIITMSLGAPGADDALLLQSVQKINDAGILLVAAAGNDGSSTPLAQPARFAEVIGVGSIESDNRVSGFSQFGPGLDLLAPGESILSTVQSSYGYMRGTSQATPHVAGAASLLLGQGVPSDQVLWYLKESAEPVVGSDVGRLQVDRALELFLADRVRPVTVTLVSLDDPSQEPHTAIIDREGGSKRFADLAPGHFRLSVLLDLDESGGKSVGDRFFETDVLLWPNDTLEVNVTLTRVTE